MTGQLKAGKKLFEDPALYFEDMYTMGANDHLECRTFRTDKRGTGKPPACRKYVWPESPFRAHKTTRRGMLIKSKHTGKCLEVGGGNKKNGANVNMWKCTGAKNQRWSVYKNGTIRSEMNWKCLDVVGGPKKAAKNAQTSRCMTVTASATSAGCPAVTVRSSAARPAGTTGASKSAAGTRKTAPTPISGNGVGKQANQIWQVVKK